MGRDPFDRWEWSGRSCCSHGPRIEVEALGDGHLLVPCLRKAKLAGPSCFLARGCFSLRSLIRRGRSAVPCVMRRGIGQDDEGVSDEALLSGMAIGDDQAGLVFVRRYQRRMFGLAIGIVGDAGRAEDVSQEAFLRIFRHATVFDARRGSVAAWALTITRNLAIDAIRLRRGVPTDPDDWTFLELTSTERAPEESAPDARFAVAGASPSLHLLPGRTTKRRAVVLATLYGRTSSEIAKAEAIPIPTAKSRLRMGMAKLRAAVVLAEDK